MWLIHSRDGCKGGGGEGGLGRKWGEGPITLFSLYVLFSKFKSCDNTLENRFFQISDYSHVYLRLIYERQWVKFPWDLYLENKTYKFLSLYVLF